MPEDLEKARKELKTQIMHIKGVLGVCTSTHWKPNNGSGDKEPCLLIYLEKIDVLDLMPLTFQGFEVLYEITPGGIMPGCD